jgi:predicted GNAT family N-acyltransferase
MQASGHIGRIAVVEDWRNRGVGTRLVEAMIEQARDAELRSVDLDSQTHAVGFYRKLGFEARGDVFMEAGIQHQNMVLTL